MQDIAIRASTRNNILCCHCGAEFKPLRRSARFCSSTCRVAAHRKPDCNANSTPHSHSEVPPASQNGSGVHRTRSEPKKAPTAEKPLSVTRGFAIVPDATWPGMYRIRRPDGTLSDMANLTRARDALRELQRERS
jgi:hypothetical protein